MGFVVSIAGTVAGAPMPMVTPSTLQTTSSELDGEEDDDFEDHKPQQDDTNLTNAVVQVVQILQAEAAQGRTLPGPSTTDGRTLSESRTGRNQEQPLRVQIPCPVEALKDVLSSPEVYLAVVIAVSNAPEEANMTKADEDDTIEAA